jgi:hypothetical protein
LTCLRIRLDPTTQRRPLPQPPSELGSGEGGAPRTARQVDEFNDAMYKQFSEETLLRCEFCARTFSDTALKHHRRACTADSPAKPAGTGLGRASLSHRVVRASSPCRSRLPS